MFTLDTVAQTLTTETSDISKVGTYNHKFKAYYTEYEVETKAEKSFVVSVVDDCPTYTLSIDATAW